VAHLVQRVIGVEREGIGDVGFAVGRRQARAAEQRGLHRVVPARHGCQQAIHRIIVLKIATREQRKRADRQAAAQQ
jgi:hypothetical protein